MNGADKDGDTNMCTDNPIILKRTLNSPSIICLQKKAEKIIPTEADIIESNKLAFNDDIGVVTNHITSMIEVQSSFPVDSAEYKELAYRIMCGQLFQQNTIDRAKGIIAKSMPSYWYSMRGYSISDDDSEEEKAKKKFNTSIMASRKPYFMTYIYPRLKKQTNQYIKNTTVTVIRRFGKYGIKTIEGLENYPDKTEEMVSFLDYYYRLFPVGNSNCVVNRMCHWYENEFDGVLKAHPAEFDYNVLKCGVDYSQTDFKRIKEIYDEYVRRAKTFQVRLQREKLNKYAWQTSVEKLAARAGKYPLFEIAGVNITKSELETIENIHNKVLERLAFTMLCLAKFGNAKSDKNDNWVNLDSKEIFKLARISCKAEERETKIGQLYQMGLLEFSRRNDNTNCQVTFVNDDSENILFISDLRELGYEYLAYKGDNFIRCADCGILTRGNKNGTKRYCKDCSGYTPQEMKTVVCVDCGKEFVVSSLNSKSNRCDECRDKREKEMKSLRNKRYYEKLRR